MSQDLGPINKICAHLHAYHVYASDPTRCVEANHYCSMVNDDMRQCIIYDSPDPGARLIGIEYLISSKLFEKLPEHERVLWHSHVYEIKSGILLMPPPPEGTVQGYVKGLTGIFHSLRDVLGPGREKFEEQERQELSRLTTFYGKIYHLWQVDRGDELPMGAPELMGSIISDEGLNKALPGGRAKLKGNNKSKFGVDIDEKVDQRKDFGKGFQIHPDADSMWKK